MNKINKFLRKFQQRCRQKALSKKKKQQQQHKKKNDLKR